MSEKKRTIDQIKKERAVTARAKEHFKEYTSAKKAILKALEDGEATIPEIASRTGMKPDEVTYFLMTMMKFGEVEVFEDDDVDEYYSYRIKG